MTSLTKFNQPIIKFWVSLRPSSSSRFYCLHCNQIFIAFIEHNHCNQSLNTIIGIIECNHCHDDQALDTLQTTACFAMIAILAMTTPLKSLNSIIAIKPQIQIRQQLVLQCLQSLKSLNAITFEEIRLKNFLEKSPSR